MCWMREAATSCTISIDTERCVATRIRARTLIQFGMSSREVIGFRLFGQRSLLALSLRRTVAPSKALGRLSLLSVPKDSSRASGILDHMYVFFVL